MDVFPFFTHQDRILYDKIKSAIFRVGRKIVPNNPVGVKWQRKRWIVAKEPLINPFAPAANGIFSLARRDERRVASVLHERGHQAGDQVLASLDHSLEDILRKSDRLFRWGGEEFLILVPHEGLEATIKLAERVRARISTLATLPEHPVTASLGVATLRADEDLEGLIQRADKALYQAKRAGRNCVVGEDESS